MAAETAVSWFSKYYIKKFENKGYRIRSGLLSTGLRFLCCFCHLLSTCYKNTIQSLLERKLIYGHFVLVPENTFRMVVLLSVKIVFCISPTIFIHKSFFSKIFSTSRIIPSMPPPSALIMSDTTMILFTTLPSRSSNASCLYFVRFSFLFISMLFSCGHAISQIHMSSSSSIKSGLLDAVVFRRLNSKSQINFACAFSRTCPLNHFFLHHLTSLFTKLYSFA